MLRVAGFCLALAAMACTRKQYICPAYQSAFQLDMLAYKIPANNDSLALAADSNAEIDVIMMLAERIRPQLITQATDIDSLTFPPDMVNKSQVLLLKKVKRKTKDKLLATVPMVTVFPETVDSTSGEELLEEEKPRKKGRAKKVVPKEYLEEEENTTQPEPEAQPEETTPADAPDTEEEPEEDIIPKSDPEKRQEPTPKAEKDDTPAVGDPKQDTPKKEEPF